jgi:hypothetical protein
MPVIKISTKQPAIPPIIKINNKVFKVQSK